MIRTKDELIKIISEYIGDDNTDSAISILEDVTDTITDFEDRAGEDWRTRYEENDREWRERYRSRFDSVDPEDGNNDIVVTKTDEETAVDEVPQTYEDLFESMKEDE